jgi:CHAD domain-containing protein
MPEQSAAIVAGYLRIQLDAILHGDRELAQGADWIYPTRVALRRTRSTLRTFASLFDTSERRHLDHELRWWAGLLGAVRDRRVQISWLEDLRRSLGDDAHAAAAITHLTEALDQQCSEARETVMKELTGARHRELTRLLEQWHEPPFTLNAGTQADDLVAFVDSIRDAFAQALSQARRPDASDLDVHEARKTGKRYRYAVELAAPLLGADAEVALERARLLQEELGHYQDSVVGIALATELGHQPGLSPQISRGTHIVVESMRVARERAKEAVLELPL